MTEASAQLDTNALVTQYLNVVNRSLGENREDFPYKQLLDASEKLFADKRVAVGVYQDDIRNPHHWFTARFGNGRFELVAQGKGDADFQWVLREAHVAEVVDHPEAFIAHPYKLDIDWLKKAVGVD